MRLLVIALVAALLVSCAKTTYFKRVRTDAEPFDQSYAYCKLEAYKATAPQNYPPGLLDSLYRICMRGKGWRPSRTEYS